ncbi:MAG: hypothetical protein RBT60_08870 [Candidatus Krumholzibacteria bacterium]|nr:hypothetical protein [Candidatus Krumholzibacteria bacterium]
MSFTQTAGQGVAMAVQQLANQVGLQVTVQNPDYVQCGIGLPNGRKQLVHLMTAGNFGDQTVVQVWTPVVQMPAGGLPANVANGLLQENATFKIGGFGIRQVQGAALLMFYQNVVLESLSPQALMTTIGVVGSTGDQWEQKLGNSDMF